MVITMKIPLIMLAAVLLPWIPSRNFVCVFAYKFVVPTTHRCFRKTVCSSDMAFWKAKDEWIGIRFERFNFYGTFSNDEWKLTALFCCLWLRQVFVKLCNLKKGRKLKEKMWKQYPLLYYLFKKETSLMTDFPPKKHKGKLYFNMYSFENRYFLLQSNILCWKLFYEWSGVLSIWL